MTPAREPGSNRHGERGKGSNGGRKKTRLFLMPVALEDNDHPKKNIDHTLHVCSVT